MLLRDVVKEAKKLLKKPYQKQYYVQWLRIAHMISLVDVAVAKEYLMPQLLTYMIALDECQRSVISREVLNEYAEGLRADLRFGSKPLRGICDSRR